MRRWVLAGGIAVLVGSALVLVVTGNTDVRYTADSDSIQPMWARWIPAVVGILLIRVLPWRLDRAPGGSADRRQAWILLGCAAAFAVLLKVLGLGLFEVLKALLLLAVPLAVFRWWGGKPTADWPTSVRWAPVLPVATFLGLSYVGPLAVPVPAKPDLTAIELVLTVVGVFFINSVLEEYFYRRWLQTRWEQLLGPWPAILLSSIAWAVWHIALQGRGELGIDLASVLVNQGVQGLFLGYLWSRYRLMWPLITVHGAINAVGLMLSLV
ncbi:CPBP family intramembrane glutamic endopeptidase [Kribbella sp. CA-293567]|uniref:CPBP family intramembrane glutamic endopeptidase n=1 Tax=Kribbella sp. CA-293567 TaxID=3002436 RepID=UPI0022DD8566|nr:CPBP family intramembrane glutamic endopeptidase [Kribbella sp. CA-293567]WBQ07999.1 CPBP family intramembrane metalloprotease [Kribbella sp. CA-293567]